MYIKTSRLELKPMERADMEALTELLTDETVGKTYMVPEFADRAAAENMAQRICDLSQNPERYVAGIFLGAQLIGMLNETEVSDGQIEVGYALLPRFYNQGYATEALTAAIDFFFAQGFRQVLCGAFEGNAASIRAMVKSGMKKLSRTDTVEYRAVSHRCVYYAISK